MARLFRALRRASAPDTTAGSSSPRPLMSFKDFMAQNFMNDLDNNNKLLHNELSSGNPVREMLLAMIDRLETDEDDDDAYNDGIGKLDGMPAAEEGHSHWWLSYINHWDSVSRRITEHDIVGSIWGVDSNHLWRVFVKIRSRMARDQTFSPELKHDISKANSMPSMIKRLQNITMADLVLPELAGWLLDQSGNAHVWCVVADMLFCIFENENSETPDDIIILPGCSVRSLVYRTAIPQKSTSKTISGIDRYQIIVDDCSSKRKHYFSVESPGELNKWMSVLKSASNLDNDVEMSPEQVPDRRRHSMFAGLSVNTEQGDHISPRYIPSPSNSPRVDRLAQTWDPGCHVDGTKTGQNEMDRRTFDVSQGPNKENSIDNIRKKLRRETDLEKTKPTPLKAKHFESPETNQKKAAGPFKKLRSFGSLESLFKPKRKGEETPETRSLTDRRFSQGTIASKSSSSSSSLETSSSEPPLVRSTARRSLSSSLEFGRSDKKASKGLVRTSSDLKEKMKGTNSDESLKLQDLHNASICGFLQYKFLIKWQKIWCVVYKGRLYGFKSQSPDEEAFLSLTLSNCNIIYTSSYDKRYKKQFVFKVSQSNKKSVYLGAPDKTELSRWLQILQMEANKVQGDSDFLDTSQSFSDACNSSFSTGMNSLDTSQDSSEISSPKFFLGSVQSDSSSKDSSLFAEQSRRFSMPITYNSGSDADIYSSSLSSSSSEVPNGLECEIPGKRFGLPVNDLPEHDPALKHVWQKDQNYLLNVVRAKLRTNRKKTNNESITNKHLPGPNNEGLMVMADDYRQNRADKRSKGSRDIRRAMSFHGADSNSKDADVSAESPSSSPTSKKRHKPLAVKKLAARDLENCSMTGYMERRSFSGTWIKYWYVLKDGTIFCYLTPDDNVTVDILNLQGYKIAYLVDKFKGKRFVLQISHDEFISTYYSLESREEMNSWLDSLQNATGEPPSPHGIIDEHCGPEVLSDAQGDQQEKYQTVKQKLLAEMLRQKHELEKKQATRNKKHNGNTQDTSETFSEEDQIRDVTRLRQRRMSAQIKMDTIQKQMQTVSSTRKFRFKLGSKKKVTENNNEVLQEQLRELTDKLHEIDRDLISHSTPNHDVLDMNQNRKSNSKTMSEDEDRCNHEVPITDSNGDVNRSNAINIKASVQKFAQKTKTFSKSVKNKNKKAGNESNGSPIINGYISDLSSTWSGPLHTSDHGSDRNLDYHGDDSEGGSESYRSDSFTDLTKDKHSPTDESVFLDNCDNNRNTQKAASTPTSPRKEIDPGILAEIDAFEDFTRQVLSARSTSS